MPVLSVSSTVHDLPSVTWRLRNYGNKVALVTEAPEQFGTLVLSAPDLQGLHDALTAMATQVAGHMDSPPARRTRPRLLREDD
jgi:hypothetical protein